MDKVISKDKLIQWIDSLRQTYEVVGPVKAADGPAAFTDVDSHSEIVLNNAAWTLPPKDYLLPRTETLVVYNEKSEDEQIRVPLAEDKPRIMMGLRACDARAIAVLDHVYLDGELKDPYYAARRKGMIMVGNVCEDARWSCFCTSVGDPIEWLNDLDAVTTDIGDSVVVTANTPAGERLLSDTSDMSDPSDEQINQKTAAWSKMAALPKRPFADKLAADFLAWDGPIWEKYSRKCIGCGICSYLCPSCSCFDIQDERVGGEIERFRCRDTCQSCYFTRMGAGHDPRPEKKMRVRQRLSHKFKYQQQQFNIIGCTGCGRCVELCPVNLDIRLVLSEVATSE
ncbi:MAG: 4Fe-4S dicluster domain-containing protein [Armatimonadota bacterium]|nr:4Fe-4S dicluster domain-containing protein [Armatimonadota bacterium]